MAPPASFAATRAAQVLQEADRTAAELERLLGVAPTRDRVPLEILLVDAAPEEAAAAPAPALAPDGFAAAQAAPILRVISPEGAAEPLARPMTRVLAARWFGPRAAA